MPGQTRTKRVSIPWLTPMRAARGPLRNLGVLGSYLVHLAGVVFFLLSLFLIDHLFWAGDLLWEIRYEVEREPASALLVIGIWVVLFKLAFPIFAYLTTCWGAGVEPFRQSFGRSLSRWYQLTPWLALLGLGLIFAMIGIEKIDDWYWDRYTDARWGDYYEEYGYDQPMQLLTRDRFELLMMIGRLSSLGIFNLIALWWILGTVAVHRIKPSWPATCRWPAVCEGCGYALAGMTDEQGCPECGKNIGSSKHAYRGTRDITSLRMLMHGLFQPRTVGAAMLTRRPTKMPLRVLLWGLFFAVLSGPALMVMGDTTARLTYGYSEVRDFGDAIEHYIAVGLTVGSCVALCGGLLLLGTGTLVGTIVRIMGKRNIMPAACNAACYSAALLPLWVLAQGAQLIVLIPLINYLRDQGHYGIARLLPLTILFMHAFILFYIILHIARITKAARHANV